MDVEDLIKRIDPLNSLLVLLLLIAGGLAFVLASMRSEFASWLVPMTSGVVLWVLAWHLRKLGRLY